jgi:excisionase family DNA binding protein
MNVAQFRRWLESKIEYIRNIPQPWQEDAVDFRGFVEEAYQIAVDLRLPEAAAACKKGPPLRRLIECLNAIPEPETGVYNKEEAAQRLGVSPRTVGRLIDDGDLECKRIRGRITITEEQLQAYLAGQETLFGWPL